MCVKVFEEEQGGSVSGLGWMKLRTAGDEVRQVQITRLYTWKLEQGVCVCVTFSSLV